MIKLTLAACMPLAVTIIPPFGDCANVAMSVQFGLAPVVRLGLPQCQLTESVEPKADKVHCSKIAAIRSPRRRWRAVVVGSLARAWPLWQASTGGPVYVTVTHLSHSRSQLRVGRNWIRKTA